MTLPGTPHTLRSAGKSLALLTSRTRALWGRAAKVVSEELARDAVAKRMIPIHNLIADPIRSENATATAPCITITNHLII